MSKLLSIISILFTERSSSFLSAAMVSSVLKNAFAKVIDFLLDIVWVVCKFVLGIMDAFQYMIEYFLGIGSTAADIVTLADEIRVPTSEGSRKYLEVFVEIFKNMMAVGLLLLIIFTIIAIVKQEYQMATSGFEGDAKKEEGNNKSGIMMRMFRGIMGIFLLPITLFIVITGFNAILTSFQEALSNGMNTTVAGQVLATSTYDANKYRTYANSNQRVPIIIEAYNSTDVKNDELADVAYKIKSLTVQKQLKAVATDLVNGTFPTFGETVEYKNNKIYNSGNYPDIFEKFICTNEQYQIMADFVDYAQLNQIDYYIRSMDDPMIEWGYVEETVFSKEKNTLSITYRDATDMNGNGDKQDTYTVEFTPTREITTPISDALQSIMAMLGVGEHAENQYKVMERDDSGEFLNLVQWANEKALLKFSEDFNKNDPNTWTDTDEIIFYEYNHFSSNNTFAKFTLEDFENGVELDVYEVAYRNYNATLGVYTGETKIYCVKINGTYYKVVQSETLTNNYGNPYYVLESKNASAADSNATVIRFLEPSYFTLEKLDGEVVNLKTSEDFDINDPDTWTYLDQVMIYEFYKDLTYNNDLSNFIFSDFDFSGSGVNFGVYKMVKYNKNVNRETNKITSVETETIYYTLINNNYYALVEDSGDFSFPELHSSSARFLNDPLAQNQTCYNYEVQLHLTGDDVNGFFDSPSSTDRKVVSDFYSIPPTADLVNYKEVDFTTLSIETQARVLSYADFSMMFSDAFTPGDISTWTYKDYFLFYLYVNLNIGSSIDSLKYVGLEGTIVKHEGAAMDYTNLVYLVRSQSGVTYAFNLPAVANISEQRMLDKIDAVTTVSTNKITDVEGNNIFVLFDESLTKLQNLEVDSKEFSFSSGFDEYIISTWTIEDFILYYLSTEDLIYPISTLKNTGYYALAYKIPDSNPHDDEDDSDTIYRFGPKSSANAIYLSEKRAIASISDNGSYPAKVTLDTWLETDLSVLVMNLYNISSESLFVAEDQLVGDILGNYTDQVLSVNSLMSVLLNDNWNGTLENILNYSYVNTDFDPLDLSTWTHFDLVLYALTGSAGIYTGPVVVGKDNNNYLIIGDKAINISKTGDKLEMNVSFTGFGGDPTDIFTDSTPESQTFADASALATFINDNYAVYMSGHTSTMHISTSVQLKYQSDVASTIDRASMLDVTGLNSLDILILGLEGKLENGKTYTFDIYQDGMRDFIKIGSTYVQIFRKTLGINDMPLYFSFRAALTPVYSSKPFVTGDVYTYTGNMTDGISDFDAVIYNYSANIEEKEYQIFNGLGKKYIAIQNLTNYYYVEYKNYTKTTITYADNEVADGSNHLMTHLYTKYYSNLYSNGLSAASSTPVVGETRRICYDLTAGSSFNIKNISTWTPFRIVLWANGIITDEFSEELVTLEVKTTPDGRMYYCGEKNMSGRIEKYYINITEICDKVVHDDNTIYYFIEDKTDVVYEMYLRMVTELDLSSNTLRNVDGEGVLYGQQYFLEDYLNLANLTLNDHSACNEIVYDYETSTNNVYYEAGNTFSKTNPSTWTWFDLLYYNANGRFINEAPVGRVYRYLSGSQQFVNIKIGEENRYYLVDDGTRKISQTFASGSETLTSGSVLDSIVKEITGDPAVTSVSKYTITTNTTDNNKKYFYWLSKTIGTGPDAVTVYYGIYNLIQEIGGESVTISLERLENNGTSYSSDKEDSEYLRFIYNPADELKPADWTIFDYILYMANGYADAITYESYLYMYSHKQYFLVNGNYLNLSECLPFMDIDITDRKIESKDIKIFGSHDDSVIEFNKNSNSPLVLYATLQSRMQTLITNVDDDEITDANATSLVAEVIKFSDDFKFSDYSTWTVADFMIYYAFVTGHYTGTTPTAPYNEFSVRAKRTEVVNGVKEDIYKMHYYSLSNFQTFVNNGGAVGYVYYLLTTDDYGSVDAHKVVNFGDTWKSGKNLYFDYDVFTYLYGKKLVQVQYLAEEEPTLKMVVSNASLHTYVSTSNNFTYVIPPDKPVGDFNYKNYYFFDVDTDKEKELGMGYASFDEMLDRKEVKKYGYLNFKLSSTFDISDIDTWTILDYIIVREFSKSAGTTNVYDMFSNMDFEDLKEDNYINVYQKIPTEEEPPAGTPAEEISIITINGNEYNLHGFLQTIGDQSSTSKEFYMTPDALVDSDGNSIPDVIDSGGYPAGIYEFTPDGGTTVYVSDIISKGSVNDYSMRTIYEVLPYAINVKATVQLDIYTTVSGYTEQPDGSVTISSSSDTESKLIISFMTLVASVDTISYVFDTAPNIRYYRSIYKNTKEIYQVDLDLFGIYEISPLVKQVGWPQKLMNDMQVLYPDLNWGTLIATDGWLDTLGEFTSAYTNGMFVTEGNSANTTAAGLVLSEFFVSEAKKSGAGYANFEYKSLFKEEVIKSLMLSLLGEEDYVNLSQQAEIFMEMFNKCFAPVLDDIARKNAINIVDGQVDNFVMCVYKSYLATVLLSSDFGEYLYIIATRIYAEYTIYESLATAAGDYGTYYAYLNEQTGEDGEIVDSFEYSSFKELVLYENKYIGVNVPVYTFNMLNVYTLKKEEAGTTQTKSEIAAEFRERKRTNVDSLYDELYTYLQNKYSNVYSSGSGQKITDAESYYCFMFDAYWDAYATIKKKGKELPAYLNNFKRYLDGSIARWNIIDDISILGATQYMSRYDKYQKVLEQTRTDLIFDIFKTYIVLIERDYNEDMDILDMIREFCSAITDGTPFSLIMRSFSSTMNDEVLSVVKNSLFVYNSMSRSEAGDADAWQIMKDFRDAMNEIVVELREIIELPYSPTGSNRTAKGSQKLAMYSENDYLYCLDVFSDFYTHLDSYVNAQEIIDMVDKASITYHLKQFGQNYVTTGYKFNIEHNDYTFNTGLSAARLAEYVYGGKYLTQYGINATYTSNDYEGIVSQTKIYDSVSNMMKTKLGMWTELRTFAGELADYTAELYFMSNLCDLSGNVVDVVKLEDYIYGSVKNDGEEIVQKTTLEYLILRYIVEESYLSPELKVALIFGDSGRHDSVENINAMLPLGHAVINKTSIVTLADCVYNGTLGTLNESTIIESLLDYLYFVQTEEYDSGYWNADGNYSQSERLHMIFKSVIEYLIVSEDQANEMEQDEELLKKKVNLDGITFKEFKIALMEKIVGYDENEEGKENSDRYLTLFSLINGQFDYYSYEYGYDVEREDYLGTILLPAEIDFTTETLKYKNNDTLLYLNFNIDNSTQNTVLRLAGLANRPIEELVGLEYENLYNRNGNYDEALGDIFIVCTYDETECRYIPVMASGKNNNIADFSSTTKYKQYYNKYGLHLRTSYYDNPAELPRAYPIIAKGIISASGLPTAIKMEDGNIKFYRTDITAATVVNEAAVAATAGVSEVSSVGYTDYVESSSYKEADTANKATMFISSLDMKTYLSSDIEVFFMQDNLMYSLYWDEYGGGSIFDNYSAYYVMGGQSYFLLVLGITTVLPILFNATASVLRRVFDLMFLTIVGPVMISMRSLSTKDGDKNSAGEKAFNTWKDYVTKTLLAALGYIVAFNVYYILVTTVMQMTFVSEMTVQNIRNIGGLSFVNINLIESIFKYMWLVAAAALIKSAGVMLTTIVTAGKVINPFAPSIGSGKGQDKEVMESVKDYGKQAVKMAKLAGDIVSGQALIELKDAALQKAMDFVPGGEMIAKGVGRISNAVGGKMLEKKAKDKGVDASTAKAGAKQLTKQANDISDAKSNVRKQNAENFANKWGGGG